MRHRLSLLTLVAGCATSMSCVSGAIAPAVAPEPSSATTWASTPIATLDGQPTDLREVVGGRVALVSFWATWCEACRREITALERLHARALTSGNAVVIGVAVGEPRAVVAAFARTHRLAYPLLVDEDFRLADALRALRVPATLVVDRGGRIVFRGGALDADGLLAFRAALEDAAGERSSGVETAVPAAR